MPSVVRQHLHVLTRGLFSFFLKILSGGEASKKERAAAKVSILNSMTIR